MRRTDKTAPRPPSRRPRADPAASLVLDETLDLNAAVRLRDSLLAARGSDLAVEASGVQFLGASCAQVLAAAVLTWKADGSQLSIKSASEPFWRGVHLLGLDSHLNPESLKA